MQLVWIIETCQRGPRTVLRSTDPDVVRQELYAYLITYQAIRALMHRAALTDADRLSFTTALRVVRRWISTATTPAALAVAHTAVFAEINQDRNHRRQRRGGRPAALTGDQLDIARARQARGEPSPPSLPTSASAAPPSTAHCNPPIKTDQRSCQDHP